MRTISFKLTYTPSSQLTAATATYTHKVTRLTKTENILPSIGNAAITLNNATYPGNYDLVISLTNSQNITTYSDPMSFRVGNCEKILPKAIAAAPAQIQLPVKEFITLNGSGSTGIISTYKWTKKTGPAINFTTPNSANTLISGMVEGTYVFKLEVTDIYGEVSETEAKITVNKEVAVKDPTLKQIGATKILNEKAEQVFEVGPDVSAGNKFSLTVYSVSRVVTASSNDNANTIAAALQYAINNTTQDEWNAQKSAPAKGTAGFPPTAKAFGNQVTVTLDSRHSFFPDAKVS